MPTLTDRNAVLKVELVRFIVITVVSISFSYLNFFNSDESSRRGSKDTFYYTIARDIPTEPPPKITIVLATDSDLDFLRSPWPLGHEYHAQIFDELRLLKPAAVFVDFLYLDVTNQRATSILRSALTELAKVTPLVIATPQIEGWEYLSDASRPLYAELKEVGIRSANARLLERQGDTLVMPPGTGSPTPAAYALYDIYCSAQGRSCEVLGSKRDEPTELLWRGTPHECRARPHATECESLDHSWPVRLLRLALGSILPANAHKTLPAAGLLPYPTINVEQLLTDPRYNAQISGSVLFFGSSFRSAGDVARSQVYGSLPGVFAHATFFDNLVTMGSRKFSTWYPFGLDQFTYSVGLILLLSLSLTTLRIIHRIHFPNLMTEFWAERACDTTIMLIGLLVAAMEAWLWRTTPEHWFLAPNILVLSWSMIILQLAYRGRQKI